MRTTKRSIGRLMWWVLASAVALALVRIEDEQLPLLITAGLAGCGIALVISGSSLIWFGLAPTMAARLSKGGLRRGLLLCAVRTPWPWPNAKAAARYLLAADEQAARRFVEAEAILRTILSDGGDRLDPGFESLVRQKLADTVEALGSPEEADAERILATDLLKSGKDSFLSLLAIGKLLDQRRRHEEAYASFERGLRLVPAQQQGVQITLMRHLMMSAFQAGRLTDTIHWAKAVLQADPRGRFISSTLRMAGIAFHELGQLDEAEPWLNDALQGASSPRDRSQALGLLANIELARGRLARAEQTAREAHQLNPDSHPGPWVTLARVEEMRGNFDQAIALRERAGAIEIGPIPASNRHVAAALQCDLAGLHAETGRLDLALELIQKAELELADGRKQKPRCDAQAALIHALRGEREEATSRMAAAEEGCMQQPQEVRTHRIVLLLLGRAALAINEPEQARKCLQMCLELDPPPVGRPMILYHLAECRRRQGDLEAGAALDREAAASRFGTLHERLARSRLESAGAPP
jgi:tetratricopeptide (TPR) repeat protein